MLLKCTADGRKIKVNGVPGKGKIGRGSAMKMTMSTTPTMSARVHRKVMRAPHKRAQHAGKLHAGKLHAGKMQRLHAAAIDVCDNSNDSGLGTDHHHDAARISQLRFSEQAESQWMEESPENKRRRMEIKLESDDANDNFSFPELQSNQVNSKEQSASNPLNIRATNSQYSPGKLNKSGKLWSGTVFTSCGKLSNSGKLGSKLNSAGKFGGKISNSGKLANALVRRRAMPVTQTGPPTLSSPLSSMSRDGRVQLQIVCQPESQHRARYQTEGSRGAVKDNSGNGFPIVKLIGYDKPAVLQVFIGTDTGRVAPHMFYQACRVSGKNSTPCTERKEDGTVLIEIDLDPVKNWQVTCDCVGILKERNVDVEHRFGEQLAVGGAAMVRGKKKSTRCRMVFRTQIVNADGTQETLQVCSSQIICTQPPGIPEICRKSLVSCPANGGFELFLLGKNFLKDTKVVFLLSTDNRPVWEEHVTPDKEFLQQTHLVCCVPPFHRTDITEVTSVQLYVYSGGKASEPHCFYYTPPSLETGPQHVTRHGNSSGAIRSAGSNDVDEVRPVFMWGRGITGSAVGRAAGGMMPPPTLPLRRTSTILPDPLSPLDPLCLKAELDDSSQHSLADGDVSQMGHSENSNVSMVVSESSADEGSMHARGGDESSMDVLMVHSEKSLDNSRGFAGGAIMQNSFSSTLMNGMSCMPGTSHSLGQDCTMMSEDMKVVDLRLKSENVSPISDSHGMTPFNRYIRPPIKMSNSPEYVANLNEKSNSGSSSDERPPLLSFSRQLQVTQTKTDKVMESVAAAFIFNSEPPPAPIYAEPPIMAPLPTMNEVERMMNAETVNNAIDSNMKDIEASIIMREPVMSNNVLSNGIVESQNKSQMMDYGPFVEKLQSEASVRRTLTEQTAQMEALVNDAMQTQIMSADSVVTAKLDALVNSTVDNHIRSGSLPDQMPPNTSPSCGGDVALSPVATPGVGLARQSPPDLLTSHSSGPISTDIILNSRVTHDLMCAQESSRVAHDLMCAQENSLIAPPTLGSVSMPAPMTTTGSSPDDLMIVSARPADAVHVPSAAVKTMILNAAAEILTSDTAMNALVTSAINTANILSNENASAQTALVCTQAPSTPQPEMQAESDRARIVEALRHPSALLPEEGAAQAAMNQVVSQAVTQAVSQAVSHAVSQAVNQEMKPAASAPMQDLTSMSDSDLLSYINPSCFDQV